MPCHEARAVRPVARAPSLRDVTEQYKRLQSPPMSLRTDVSLSAIVAGFVTLLVGFPRELVLTIAGLALLGTNGNGLATALSNEKDREPAFVTFLVTVSGVTLLCIGSAFWGLLAGVLAWLILRSRRAG